MTIHSTCGSNFSNTGVQQSKRVLVEPKTDTLMLFLQQQQRQTTCAVKIHCKNMKTCSGVYVDLSQVSSST